MQLVTVYRGKYCNSRGSVHPSSKVSSIVCVEEGPGGPRAVPLHCSQDEGVLKVAGSFSLEISETKVQFEYLDIRSKHNVNIQNCLQINYHIIWLSF